MTLPEASQMDAAAKPQAAAKKIPKKIYFYVSILYLLFMSDFICRLGINAIFPLIQSDMGLTDPQIGMLGSIVLLSMSLFVLPISFLADKWSKKKTITLMSGLWSISTMIFAMAGSFPLMLLSRLGVGMGNSAYAPTSTSMITSWFPKEKWGKLLGIYNTAMPIGSAIGSILCGALATKYGWRTTVGAVAVFSMITFILSLLIPETNGKAVKKAAEAVKQTANKASRVTVKSAVKIIGTNRSLILVCIAAGCFNFTVGIHSTWTVMYYVREVGLSITFAATLLGVVGIVSSAMYPIGGIIMDKWYKKDIRSRVWFPALMYTTKGLICMYAFYTKNIPLIIIAGLLLQMAVSCGHAANQELVPAQYKAFSYGIYVVFLQALGAIGPTVSGFLVPKMGLTNMLVAAQGLYFISAIFFVLAGFSYIKDFQKARAIEQAESTAS